VDAARQTRDRGNSMASGRGGGGNRGGGGGNRVGRG
jgi:hypothetical protein